MTRDEKLAAFAALHRKGEPLILYNIWDAGSARAVASAGAKAVATGSLSVAGAQGYPDGEAIPLSLLATVAERIAASLDLPLTVDFEGGYAPDPETLAANGARIAATGAVGVNFEDQVLGGAGLHAPEIQAARIAALKRGAEAAGAPLWINARTDLFLKAEAADHAALLDQAILRAQTYADAGGSSFFAPGLSDPDLIRRLCAEVELPVNVMTRGGREDLASLATLGVGRISYGPFPWRQAMAALEASARDIFA